jgi:hydrophobic/amphiphilic exporter-1 (mainly G- bacteria), HAE1 family
MFSKFFIYRPIFAAVISIVIVLIGVLSIPLLPVESMPDITPPSVSVTTSFPGASAAVVAETVAAPLEEKINGVEDMLYMSSKSSADGSCAITVTFEVGTDVDMATVLVQNRVNEALPVLPEETKRQGVKVEKKATNITLMVNMVSPDGTFDELYISNYATTRIKDVLARVNGVSKVDIMGAKDFGMRIWMDPLKLRARGLTTMDLLAALQEQNVQVAAGQIGGQPAPPDQPFEYAINTLGRLQTAEQFEDIIVKRGEEGQLVRIKDVARVELGAQSYKWFALLDGAPSIAISVYPAPGANALEIANGIKSQMERLGADFPEGLESRIIYDTTEYITQSVKEVISTLIIAILLVIFTVYIFLQDVRTTLVPAITIPVSLLGTFGVMLAMGLSINGLTLFGLILVIGIVVDDAIVVVENTIRIIDTEGLDSKAATAKSMVEISGPVIATTLVLLAVFVPTIVMPGITGRLYRPFAITISVATLFSSLNALTLSPALCGMLLRPSKERKKGFFGLFNRIMDSSTTKYTALVTGLLRKAAFTALVFVGLLVATWFGVTSLPTGFVPSEDEGWFMIAAQLPDASSLGRSAQVLDQVAEIIEGEDSIRGAIYIGGYNVLDTVVSPNAGAVWVVLKHWDDRPDAEDQIQAVVDRLNPQLREIEDAMVFAVRPPPIQGLGATGGFQMELQDVGGVGPEILQLVASDIIEQGRAHPVLTGMNTTFRAGVPELFLEVDREKAKRLDVPLDVIFGTLQANLGSAYANDFNLFGRTWKVYVQADEQFRIERADITKLEVRSNSGRMIPLSTLLHVTDTVGSSTVSRYNLYSSASVTGDAAAGYSSGQSIETMQEIADTTMPPGMSYDWTGVTYQQIAAGGAAGFIFALAIVFVYLFLAAQYESWTLPLSVIFTVPIAVLGAAVATLLRGMDNNVYMQIGLVLLIGLASKSAILIVEFANQLNQEGKTAFEAATAASTLRFRAILMTAFSFILGVIPLVIATGAGAASRVSLGTAVFGGMLLATIGGLIITPYLYYMVARLSEKKGSGQPSDEPPSETQPIEIGAES